jgi:hypothetical protein
MEAGSRASDELMQRKSKKRNEKKQTRKRRLIGIDHGLWIRQLISMPKKDGKGSKRGGKNRAKVARSSFLGQQQTPTHTKKHSITTPGQGQPVISHWPGRSWYRYIPLEK